MTLSAALHGGIFGTRWPPLALGSTALGGWFDADDAGSFTLSGSNVSQWNDLSGNGAHATQGTDANRPTRQTNVLNGGACVRFDGTNDFLTTGYSLSGRTSFATYMVVKADAANAAQSIIRQSSGTDYYSHPWTNAKALTAPVVILSWNGGTTTTNASGALTSATISGFVRVSGSTNKVFRNGTEESSRAANTTAAPTFTINLRFGCDYVPGEFFDGDLHEVILVNGELATADRERIEGYLAWKWGLTGNLPAGHAFKNIRP